MIRKEKMISFEIFNIKNSLLNPINIWRITQKVISNKILPLIEMKQENYQHWIP
jgi:hypothetical protein